MPSVNYEIDGYHNCIDQLQGLNDRYTTYGIVLFCGDFNANITADNDDRMATTISHYLQANNLTAITHNSKTRHTFNPSQKILAYVIAGARQTDMTKCYPR